MVDKVSRRTPGPRPPAPSGRKRGPRISRGTDFLQRESNPPGRRSGCAPALTMIRQSFSRRTIRRRRTSLWHSKTVTGVRLGVIRGGASASSASRLPRRDVRAGEAAELAAAAAES